MRINPLNSDQTQQTDTGGHTFSAPTMADFTSSIKSRVSALAENARDLTLDFEAASGSRFFDNDDQTMKEVQSLLSSRLDREKLEALRRLVAVVLIAKSLIVAHVSRHRCVQLLCLCHPTDCFPKSRNQKVGLYLLAALCRVKSRSCAHVHQYNSEITK